jgi:hypothetical protein
MKKVVITTSLLIFLLISARLDAQTLEESLNSTFIRMDSAKSVPDMMSISAQFEMIANKWSNEWSANYYAAFSKVIISFIIPDTRKKDLLLDEAEKYLAKVKSINSKSDETYVLGALITNARISVDGQNRAMQYAGAYNQDIEKAKSINPDNPRIYYMMGSSAFYTPEMYGGGKAKAKPLFEKAAGLFAKEDKSSVLKPHWGEKENENYLKQCDEK